jgi:hypothetical protein
MAQNIRKLPKTIDFTLPQHCNGNPICVFLEKELPGLSPNFYIHVSLTDTLKWKLGLRLRNSLSRNNCFEFRYCVFTVHLLQCLTIENAKMIQSVDFFDSLSEDYLRPHAPTNNTC